MIPNFNIATDLKVEFFLPNEASNLFILGVSLLGGDDVLAGQGSFILGQSLLGGDDVLSENDYAYVWTPVEAEVTEANISLGGSIIDSLYFQPDPGTLALSMQSWTFDPNNNSAVRPGTMIRVRIDHEDTQHTLFSGFLDTIDVTYNPGEYQPNQIRIRAYDGYKRLVNTRIADFDTTGLPAGYATPNDVFEKVAEAADFVVSDMSETLAGKLPVEQVLNSTAATFINDATQVGLAVVWIDPETSELVYINRPTVTTTPPAGTWTIGNNHGDPYHLCMSDIQVSGTTDAVLNSLYLELSSDPDVNVTLTDLDSIQLYGYSSSSATLNTTDEDELTRWGQAVFAQSPTKLVSQVETPAIDRDGTLTEAATFTPGTLIGVNYETDNIVINDYYTIVRASHSIDVNNWFTTLELWKEF
jgi:hypothetical protein